MKRYAPAKVNLALDVIGKRADGYHELDMIMAPIDLYDVVEAVPNGTDQDRIMSNVPLPENNTLTKAMAVLRKRFEIGGHDITVTKAIPEQAGLAGGSADAAALLHIMNDSLDLGLSQEALLELGNQTGADVPFCLVNRTSRVKGTGEQVTVLPHAMDVSFLLVKPESGVSTPACFSLWDAGKKVLHDVDLVQTALEKDDLGLLYSTMCNGLEGPARTLCPELDAVWDDMSRLGLVRIMMTGSGSALMGFSVDREVLEEAAEELKKKYPFVRICTTGGRS